MRPLGYSKKTVVRPLLFCVPYYSCPLLFLSPIILPQAKSRVARNGHRVELVASQWAPGSFF